MTPTTVITSTQEAARQYGGFSSCKNRAQRTHDAHVAEIYLRLLAADRTVRARWVAEDMLDVPAGEKIPDAIIKGEPDQIVEFSGRYSRPRLQQFHDFCESRNHAYRLF